MVLTTAHQSLQALLLTAALLVLAMSCGTPTEVETTETADAAAPGTSAEDAESGATSNDGAADSPNASSDEDADPGDDEQKDSSEIFRPRSPIAEFLGHDYGDAEASEAEFIC